ncbi:MAG: serpin family protein, partial [Ruminococcus sp.]|nr:serpin family protein [Ruminococcus sp.]
TAKNLTVDIQSNEIAGTEADEKFILGQTEFALSLFKKELKDNENTLVSPYSVMQALSMTANGADGATKAEMEDVLGMPIENLNKYLYTQRTSQHSDENSRLSTANSIWTRSDVGVNQDFLQTNVDYYNADFFTAPFNDTTLTDINNWVNDKTDKMIPNALDEISADAAMYLINAIAFDAKWEVEFNKDMTAEAEFTAVDNTKQKADMMNSKYESYYIEDENAYGLYKYYKGRKYAFSAVMPKDENVSINDYIANLTAESLNNLLANPQNKKLAVSLPKFSYDFDTLLNDTLSSMGMPTAFDEKNADFSNMIDRNSYISRVIHKTHIDVDEAGTKAGAATIVEVKDNAVWAEEYISFDRPFFYCIIDTETNIPVFMGTLMSIP